MNALSLTEITFAVKMRAHDINYTQSFSFLFRFFFNFLLIRWFLVIYSHIRVGWPFHIQRSPHTQLASSNVLWRRQQYSEIKWINYYYSCVAYRTSISCEQEQPESAAFIHIYHVRCGRCVGVTPQILNLILKFYTEKKKHVALTAARSTTDSVWTCARKAWQILYCSLVSLYERVCAHLRLEINNNRLIFRFRLLVWHFL